MVGKVENRTISTSNQVEVEVEAELANSFTPSSVIIKKFKIYEYSSGKIVDNI